MVTIREIAQRAGYSQATVSRLLNGDPTLSVKDDTRRKIIAVSEELGYATQTPRIALPRAVAVLSNFTPDEDLQDAYFNELRDVLERSAGRQRMDLTSFSTIGELIGHAAHFDGFIAIGPSLLSAGDLHALHAVLPYGVFIDVNPAPDLFDSVQPDLSQTILDALDRLIASGKRRIGYIGGTGYTMGLHGYPEDSRLIAFRNWSERLGVETDGLIYAGGAFTVDNGRRLGELAIRDHAGALQAFNAAGVLIPRDTSVVSINDQSIARYTSPPLTTYAIDQNELADTAITMLAEAIARRRAVRHHTFISTPLVVRGSFVPAH